MPMLKKATKNLEHYEEAPTPHLTTEEYYTKLVRFGYKN
jgi:hypothetical protein